MGAFTPVSKSGSLKGTLLAYLYLTPAILLILVVFIYPVIDLLFRSTTQMVGGARVWTGLRAYQLALADRVFWISLGNNLRLFIAVPIMVGLALVIASLIFERVRGRFRRDQPPAEARDGRREKGSRELGIPSHLRAPHAVELR